MVGLGEQCCEASLQVSVQVCCVAFLVGAAGFSVKMRV